MATYPPVYAGTKVTAAFLESMLPLDVVKAATETVTSSTTFQDDNELFVPVAANATYRFDILLLHSSGTTGKIKIQFTAPAGASTAWGVIGVNSAVTSSTVVTDLAMPSRVLSDTLVLGGGNLTGTTALISGSITTSSTAGNLTLQWAQNTSDGAATQVRAGSTLSMKRIS